MNNNDFIEKFISLSDEFYQLDFFEWLKTHIKVEHSGMFQPFTFTGHEPLMEIYQIYNHPHITLRKAAQLGLSTYSSIASLYLGLRFNISTGYYFPTDDDMDYFVTSKFDPIIENCTLLSAMRDDAKVDNMGLKIFKNFMIYFRGAWTKRKVKSITVDQIILDEFDETNQENIKFAADRMLHSKHRLIKELSQPSIENFGIDASFKKSDQRFWGVRCTCRTWNFPDETFPDCIKKRGNSVYIGCIKCNKKLDITKGKWIPKFPDKSKHHAGFQLSHLIFGITPPERILSDWLAIQTTSERKRYMISILGRPYSDPTTQPITLQTLIDAERDYTFITETNKPSVCGIDVGDKCHIVIGHLHNNKLRVHCLAEILSDNEQKIIDLLKRHNVQCGLVDAGPYKTLSKNICRAFDNKIYLHYIRRVDGEKQGSEGLGDLSVNKLTSDRTESLDNTIGFLQDGRIELPSYKKTPLEMQELYNMFRTHCQFLIKETVVRSNGIAEFQYKHNVANHFGMALNSCTIAAFQLTKKAIQYENRFIGGNFY
jgi:hypothetical protein